MRFFGKLAFTVAAVGLAVPALPVTAQESGGHRVAVVDVAKIFKEHPKIRGEVEKIENDLKSYDTQLQGRRDEYRQAVEKLKTFKAGTPDYTNLEEQIASMESRLRLDMARKQKELADAEAKIYYDNYKKIAAAVAFLADYNKVNLVLRYNSEEMDLEQGESVVRGVMKNIVFHDKSLDMTPVVMQYLDKMGDRVASPPAAAQTR